MSAERAQPAAENWVMVRLTAVIEGTGRFAPPQVSWRLEAKPPGGSWTTRHTVAFGREKLAELQWPPSRDDALAILTEVLLGIRWEP